MKDNAGENVVVDVDFIHGAGIWIAHSLIGHSRIWRLSDVSINLKIIFHLIKLQPERGTNLKKNSS